MAKIKSALKRMRQNEKRRLRNRAVRSKVRTVLKVSRSELIQQSQDAQTLVAEAIRVLDRAVSKGVVHRNTAARKKSALARRLAALHQSG
ncbi:MAG: 30S ribosomal protein S20 [Candidatus Methylomirabilia bacterium]